MDIDKIRVIVNNGILPADVIERKVIELIAEDEKAIVDVLALLNSERQRKERLLMEMNTLLSKSFVGLKEPKINKDNFIQKEIIEFYRNHKKIVSLVFSTLQEEKQIQTNGKKK